MPHVHTRSFSTRTLAVLLLAPLFFISCSSGGAQNAAASTDSSATATTPSYDAALVKGKVVDSIPCRDGSQDFALYLPSNYTSSKPYPCIYFFDPHGHGGIPLRMYKDLAEKYGFVFVGCNSSRNGMQWQVVNNAVNALFADTRARINIDPRRVYAAGFSGGSRVASSLALMDGGIAGVIGCAAGFPNGNPAPVGQFDYFGLVGNLDFNLIEMEQLDSTLIQNQFLHQLVVFNGKHGWAPEADFQTAMLWMQVNGIKEHLQPQDNALVSALKDDYDKRIAAAKSANDLIMAEQLLAGTIKVLNGLQSVDAYQEESGKLLGSPAYNKALDKQAAMKSYELDQQKQFAQHFTSLDEKWWARKTAELDESAQGKTPEARLDRRLLNYLGFVSYMSVGHALQTNDLPNAELYLRIFKMADPQNPDQRFLSALYYIQKGDNAQVIASLKEAASVGYSDVAQLMTTPALSSLQADPAFKSILATVRANAAK